MLQKLQKKATVTKIKKNVFFKLEALYTIS